MDVEASSFVKHLRSCLTQEKKEIKEMRVYDGGQNGRSHSKLIFYFQMHEISEDLQTKYSTKLSIDPSLLLDWDQGSAFM
jgi:hypothetical protein